MVTRAGVSRPDAIRAHNLGMLLGQIHRDGELTRAQLTQRLGLSRSTIGVLVADLTELGIVAESVPTGGARAGRPSHVVGPLGSGPYAVAVDLDVVDVSTAAVGIGGHILARYDIVTDPRRSPRVIAECVVEACAKLATAVPEGAWPIGIGVSVPGTVARNYGTVEFAPNLGWRDEPLGSLLGSLVPDTLTVSVGNDADLAVVAEHLRGAGRGCDDVIYLMGRIGVGAGVIVNGRPLSGYDGHAGEVGHNVVDASGPKCHCGKRGCVETFIGDAALLRLAQRDDTPTRSRVESLFADADSGDECARHAIRTAASSLGHVLADLVNILDPERVILGGSLVGVLAFAEAQVRQSLDSYLMRTNRKPVQLCAPAFGDDSSLLGAAELVFADLLTDPIVTVAAART